MSERLVLTRTNTSYYTYILACDDGSYYTGYTSNPANRAIRHVRGRGARYTRMHKPTQIVYLQRLRSRRAAMKREREIKELSHNEKERLVSAGISLPILIRRINQLLSAENFS